MDSPKLLKSDPAVLLLNEIDILLAQTRLLELYLKQSQATAANERARLHEEYQAEMNRLRLRSAEAKAGVAERIHHDLTLQNRLSEQQRLIESRDAEIDSAKSETAPLRDRIAKLEIAHQQAQAVAQEMAINRQDLQVELAALRHQLEKNQADFQKQQLISRGLQATLEAQLAQLQDQLSERQSTAQSVATELQQARLELATLHAQVAELQANRAEAQAAATQELESTRTRLQVELANLQTALAARDRALQANQSSIVDIERSLKTDILTLRSQLEQKHELVEFRDDELRDAHGQLAALQQRIIELESTYQSAAANAEENERRRLALENELSALHHEVAVRERTLTERQEAISAVELAFHGKIHALQQEQARSRSVVAERENELHSAHVDAAALRERISQLEAEVAADRTARQLDQETRHSLEAELTSLHATLAQKEHALKEQENFFRSAEERLGREINLLRDELAQQQAARGSTHADLEQLRGEITALEERNSQSELLRRQLEENSQRAAAHRQELEARLQAREDEFRATQANAQEQKEAALREQERELRSAADRLTAEIGRLHSQLEERQALADQSTTELGRLRSEIAELQERNSQSESSRRQLEENWQRAAASDQELQGSLRRKDDELRDAHGQLAALQQRIIELESTYQSAAANAEENERRRLALENELSALHHEVAVRERALIERQEAVSAVELELRDKIHALQQEQARSRSVEAELTSLHETLAQKEHALKEQENFFRSAEERLGGEINLLRGELAQQQAASESSNAELERLRSQSAELQERNTQAELARRQLEENWQRAIAHRQELETRLQAQEDEFRAAQANTQEQKEVALREQERELRSATDRLTAEIGRLHGQLEERQSLADQGHTELGRLRAEIAELQERNTEAELARRQLQGNWQRAVASEQELQTGLRLKEDELRVVQTNVDELQGEFEATIARLQFQLTETGLLAENRAAEIENLTAEVDRLSERVAQLDTVQTKAQSDFQKELESTRVAHQAAMAAVHEEHRGRQQDFENELAQERQISAEMRSQVAERERLVDEARAALKIRQQEFEAAATESAPLRTRLAELEIQTQAEKAAAKTASDQALSRSETELISLRSELQQKAWTLAQQQASVENLALAHKSQFQKLETKLAEQQNIIKDRNLDLEKTQSHGLTLQKRIEELETELQHAQLTALSRVEQMTHDYSARIDDLNFQLADKTSVLQERDLSESNLEQTLRIEINRLIREAEQRNQILQDRNDELVRVKAEMDSLQERFTQLELATSQTQNALAGETERIQTEFQARLALLQADLSQKEWALEERVATTRGLEQTHHEELESLRKQLAEKQPADKPDGQDYVLGEPQLTQAREQGFHMTESAHSNDQHSRQAAQGRRWHSGFAWKRRWKS